MDYVTLDEARKFLDTDENLSDAITRASARIRALMQNPVIYETATDVLHGGSYKLILSYYPIVDGTVTVTDIETGKTIMPDFINKAAGILERRSRWEHGHRRWEVSYSAGLAETVEDVPQDIKTATLLLVQEEVGEEFLQYESVGDYHMRRFNDASTLARVKQLLAPYVRR